MPTAGSVMRASAALLNDVNRTKFTYAAQVPYLNIAIKELIEEMELHNVSTTAELSSVINVATTTAEAQITPLPSDLIEIQEILERPEGGLSSDFIPMTKVDYLPSIPQTSQFRYWVWYLSGIKTLGATADIDVKIRYIAKVQGDVVDENSNIAITNSDSFLQYRNAALCALFIGENKSRADDLNGFAAAALDRFLGIDVKANQGMGVRRLPFNFAYKRRGNNW